MFGSKRKKTDPQTMVITRDELKQALRAWELDARMGRCKTREQSVAEDLDANAEGGTNVLWGMLNRLKAADALAAA